MAFKVLHCLLMFLRRSLCLECAEVSSFTRLWIFLAGIQPVLAGFQFPDHDVSLLYSYLFPGIYFSGYSVGACICAIKRDSPNRALRVGLPSFAKAISSNHRIA